MIEPVRLPALRVHDGRARSVQRSDAMVNGRFDEKGPLIGDVARHVDDGAVSFGFQVLSSVVIGDFCFLRSKGRMALGRGVRRAIAGFRGV